MSSSMYTTPFRRGYGGSKSRSTPSRSVGRAGYYDNTPLTVQRYTNRQNNPRKLLKTTNPWKNTYSIPVECGRDTLPTFEERSRWTNPRAIPLKDPKRKAICAGLNWEIYIHPNHGRDGKYFALSVLPVRYLDEEVLPDNYKLRYTVQTNVLSSDAHDMSLMAKRDMKEEKELKYDVLRDTWTRELESIPHDISEVSISNAIENGNAHMANMSSSNGTNNNVREFHAYIKQLSFSTDDLMNEKCIEIDDHLDISVFHLNVKITVTFVRLEQPSSSSFSAGVSAHGLRSRNIPSRYYGVMGAILAQVEKENEKLQEALNRKIETNDRYYLSLEKSVEEYKEKWERTQEAMKTLQETANNLHLKYNDQLNKVQEKHHQQVLAISHKQGDKDATIFKMQDEIRGMREQFDDERSKSGNEKQRLQDRIHKLEEEIRELEKAQTQMQGDQHSMLEESFRHFQQSSTIHQRTPNVTTYTPHVPLSRRSYLPGQFASPQGGHASRPRQHLNTSAITMKTASPYFQDRRRLLPSFEASSPQRGVSGGADADADEEKKELVQQEKQESKQRPLWSSGAEPVNLYRQHGSEWKHLGTGTFYVFDSQTQTPNLLQFAFHSDNQWIYNAQVSPLGVEKRHESVSSWRVINEKKEEMVHSIKFKTAQQNTQFLNVCQRVSQPLISAQNDQTAHKEEAEAQEEELEKTAEVADEDGAEEEEEQGSEDVGYEEAVIDDELTEDEAQEAEQPAKKEHTQAWGWNTGTEDNAVATGWPTAEDTAAWGSSFDTGAGDKPWNFTFDQGNSQEEAAVETTQAAQESSQPISGVEKSSVQKKGSDEATLGTGEENCVEYTLKPIAPHLEEKSVESGHEQENLIDRIPFKKLYRYGKDVTEQLTWKNRASSSSVGFYENKRSKKVRMVVREELTEKLRLNHYVPTNVELKPHGSNAWRWAAIDPTIAAEDDSDGLTSFAIRFADAANSEKFQTAFVTAQEANKASSSHSAAQTQVQAAAETEEKEDASPPQKAGPPKLEQESPPKPAETESQAKKPMTEEEWLANERRKKNERAKKIAGLFGDTENDQMGTSGTGFDFNLKWDEKDETQANNKPNLFDFSGARGVDLTVPAKESEKNVDVSFGFSPEKDKGKGGKEEEETTTAADTSFSNVTFARGGDASTESEPTLGLGNFSFAEASAHDSDSAKKEKPKDSADAGFAQFASGGFGSLNDKESDWASGNADFASFGAFDSNIDFSSGFGAQKDEGEAAEGQEENAHGEGQQKKAGETDHMTLNADGDNCVEYTLKPIVELEEQQVQSGHEEEKALEQFAFKKLYRWGQDVTGKSCWKDRCSKSKIEFYQMNDTGKIRMIAREQLTNKLRMNQYVMKQEIKKRSDVIYQFIGVDGTIQSEDESTGMSSWMIKFDDVPTANAFRDMFENAVRNNAELD